MRLDDVVLGRADFRAVIDEICREADQIIGVLRAHTGPTVDLSQPPTTGRGHAKRARNTTHAADIDAKPVRTARKPHQRKPATAEPTARPSAPPTPKMIAFAERVAKDKNAKLPKGYDRDFQLCRQFLDQHASR
jgi:DNA topoisomerase III